MPEPTVVLGVLADGPYGRVAEVPLVRPGFRFALGYDRDQVEEGRYLRVGAAVEIWRARSGAGRYGAEAVARGRIQHVGAAADSGFLCVVVEVEAGLPQCNAETVTGRAAQGVLVFAAEESRAALAAALDEEWVAEAAIAAARCGDTRAAMALFDRLREPSSSLEA